MWTFVQLNQGNEINTCCLFHANVSDLIEIANQRGVFSCNINRRCASLTADDETDRAGSLKE